MQDRELNEMRVLSTGLVLCLSVLFGVAMGTSFYAIVNIMGLVK